MAESSRLCLFVPLLWIISINKVDCGVKTWRHDVDITNPDNWIGGGFSRDCEGTIFQPLNTAPVFIDKLSTKQVVLPRDGEIDIIDGGWIELSPSNTRCVRLKALNYHDWYDLDSWHGDDVNAATPDLEKIPCQYDRVEFPKGTDSRVTIRDPSGAEAGSMIFGKIRMSDSLLHSFTYLQGFEIIFRENFPDRFFGLQLNNDSCKDATGCLCHNRFIPCPISRDESMIDEPSMCLDPIEPHGFCSKMCGAYLVFKPGNRFKIDEIRRKLAEYKSDSHVSKIRKDLIQVVFAENGDGYSGNALYDADDFYASLKDSGTVKNLIVTKSGVYYVTGTVLGTFSLLFGTLLMVLVTFGGLFYYFGETGWNFDALRRWNLRSGSIFNASSFFARFDNTDEQLIIDQSRAGSVASLAPRSFDNPMFGQRRDHLGDDVSTDDDDHQEIVEKVNPLYDISLKSIQKSEE